MTGCNIFSFFTSQWTVIYHELHSNCRFRNLLERNWLWIFRRTQGISNVKICNTGNCNDGTDVGLTHLHLIQSIEFIQLADFYFFAFIRVVMVYKYNFLIYGNLTIVNLTNTDTSYIFIVIDGTDEYLCTCFRVTFRCWNVINDGIEQCCHIRSRHT